VLLKCKLNFPNFDIENFVSDVSMFYGEMSYVCSFGAPGVEFYGQKEKEINVSHLYFIPGQVCERLPHY
jgi:hypothetical protein